MKYSKIKEFYFSIGALVLSLGLAVLMPELSPLATLISLL